MVLLIDNQYVPIDVKVERFDHRKNKWCAAVGAKKDVYIVLVNPESYKIRWQNKHGGRNNPKCPPGLESFWS